LFGTKTLLKRSFLTTALKTVGLSVFFHIIIQNSATFKTNKTIRMPNLFHDFCFSSHNRKITTRTQRCITFMTTLTKGSIIFHHKFIFRNIFFALNTNKTMTMPELINCLYMIVTHGISTTSTFSNNFFW